MDILTPSDRRALRAKAHHLDPVVIIGQHGLTAPVLHEIDVALLAHELIKIRVFSDVRADRDALLERICAEMGAAPIQHLGKILTVWRRAPKPEPEAAATKKPGKRSAAPRTPGSKPTGAGKRRTVTGGKAPQERRRAPATTKGPFEPGKRTSPTAGRRGPASGKRSRDMAMGAAKETAAGSAHRRSRAPAAGTPASSAPMPSTRRRRRQP